MEKITLNEIAKELKISISTVSKALNGYSDISLLTKEKVLSLSKKLNFIPNRQAAYLRTKKTKVIGVILPYINNFFFSDVIKGIVSSADQNEYLVINVQSNESYENEKKLIEKLLQQNVDGIFISLAKDTYKLDHLEKVKNSNTILVQFDKISKLVKSSKVVIDDFKSAYLATDHLIKNGCKNIVHLRGPLLPQISIDRFLGYKKALEDNKIPFDSEKVILLDKMNDKEGYRLMNQFISKKIKFDGIFSISDYAAIGAVESLKSNNFNIPEDIKVVGFGNWLLTEKLTPSLTTIEQPGVLIGEKCFELFIKETNAKSKNIEFEYIKEVVTAKLIKRRSSKKKI